MNTGDKTQEHGVTTSTARKDERTTKWQIYPTSGGSCVGCQPGRRNARDAHPDRHLTLPFPLQIPGPV